MLKITKLQAISPISQDSGTLCYAMIRNETIKKLSNSKELKKTLGSCP